MPVLISALVVLMSGVSAAPRIEVGCKAIADLRSTGITFYDSAGHELLSVAYHKPSVGTGLLLEYRPCSYVGLRLDVVQWHFYLEGGGDVRVLPALGAEFTLAPPVGWSVRPYIWGGLHAMSLWGNATGVETYRAGPEFSLRLGPGVRWTSSPRFAFYGEVQLWSSETYTLLVPGFGVVRDHFSAIAIEQLRLGFTFCPGG